MRRLVEPLDRRAGVHPRRTFAAAWLAAFLGVILVIGAVYWALWAVTQR